MFWGEFSLSLVVYVYSSLAFFPPFLTPIFLSFEVISQIFAKLETNRSGPAGCVLTTQNTSIPPPLTRFLHRVPLVLVGNKADLSGEREVSEDEGRRMAAECHAYYLESSAKSNQVWTAQL